jgi:signal transduction histidine kinase
VLVALSMALLIGSTVAGGVLLHHAAVIERQSLRMQRLGSAAFQLQDVVSRVESNGGLTPALAAEQERTSQTLTAAFQRVRAHDTDAGKRLSASYAAYERSAARALAEASRPIGVIPVNQQRRLERRLAQLESRIDAEIGREAHASRVTNPRARLALIVAAAAAAILVGLLIWQFEIERRAGRIDRDNARRSEELIRLRDEFVASVSHELRTPLTSILGYLELIRENEGGIVATDDGAFLDVVSRNADRLLRLVSDLLLVAELEGGTISLHPRDVDLGALAADCVETAKPSADARQISLSLIQESQASAWGDPMRLAQMMDNLVSNALKFTPAHGRVTVRTSSGDGQSRFEVTDTGPGIPGSEQAHLFEPFFRAQAARTYGIQGTGLGLTITKAIVDAHRGSIDLESSPDSGTTFRIALPQRAPDGEHSTPELAAAVSE